MRKDKINIDLPIKYKREKIIRDFLLSFFSPESNYAEKQVNGFWLIKQFNKMWTVAVYTAESYLRRKGNKKRFTRTSYTRPRGNGESEVK